MGIFSFNGNKIITAGGGGVIVTDDEVLAKRAKHLTAKSSFIRINFLAILKFFVFSLSEKEFLIFAKKFFYL
jgi:hypothetical protein